MNTSKKDIAKAFNIPPELLNDTNNITYQNYSTLLTQHLHEIYDIPRYKKDLAEGKDPKEIELALLVGYYDKK